LDDVVGSFRASRLGCTNDQGSEESNRAILKPHRLVHSALGPKGAATKSYFYEIRSSDSTVLKRYGGFPTQEAAKVAGREDAKKMKNSRLPDSPDVGRIMVGQNTDKPTQY
jgi:hypothetical protein